jgi:hypothetical protein
MDEGDEVVAVAKLAERDEDDAVENGESVAPPDDGGVPSSGGEPPAGGDPGNS